MFAKLKRIKKRDRIILAVAVIAIPIIAILSLSTSSNDKNLPICNGKDVFENCIDDKGVKYAKYIYHEATKEITETINHPAQPAKTHIVTHEPVYGTRQNKKCITTTISNKHGSCALSKCRDGEYSGSAGRGTCSYHGGVAQSGGPWYYYETETYIITPGWTETIIDEPAKEAWTETKIIAPAKAAYFEKVPAAN